MTSDEAIFTELIKALKYYRALKLTFINCGLVFLILSLGVWIYIKYTDEFVITLNPFLFLLIVILLFLLIPRVIIRNFRDNTIKKLLGRNNDIGKIIDGGLLINSKWLVNDSPVNSDLIAELLGLYRDFNINGPEEELIEVEFRRRIVCGKGGYDKPSDITVENQLLPQQLIDIIEEYQMGGVTKEDCVRCSSACCQISGYAIYENLVLIYKLYEQGLLKREDYQFKDNLTFPEFVNYYFDRVLIEDQSAKKISIMVYHPKLLSINGELISLPFPAPIYQMLRCEVVHGNQWLVKGCIFLNKGLPTGWMADDKDSSRGCILHSLDSSTHLTAKPIDCVFHTCTSPCEPKMPDPILTKRWDLALAANFPGSVHKYWLMSNQLKYPEADIKDKPQTKYRKNSGAVFTPILIVLAIVASLLFGYVSFIPSFFPVKPFMTLGIQRFGARDVVFSSDGRKLASCGGYGIIKVWETVNWTRINNFMADDLGVNCIAFTSDASSLFSGGPSGQVVLWSLDNNDIFDRLYSHRLPVNSLDVCNSGRFLVSGSADQTVKIWDIERGEVVNRLDRDLGPVDSVVFSDDCSYIVIGAEFWQVNVYNFEELSTGWSFAQEYIGPVCVAAGHNNSLMAYGNLNGHLSICNLDNSITGGSIEHYRYGFIDIAFSHDGTHLITATTDRKLRSWSVPKLTLEKTYGGIDSNVTAIDISPDDQILVCACTDGRIQEWHTGF
jgi:hypothetical protein